MMSSSYKEIGWKGQLDGELSSLLAKVSGSELVEGWRPSEQLSKELEIILQKGRQKSLKYTDQHK